jgi:hypothetical protein
MTILFALRWLFLALFVAVVTWTCWSALRHDDP